MQKRLDFEPFFVCYYLYTSNSTVTISGGLKSLNGKELLPIPRLIISVVVLNFFIPRAYFGKKPWLGTYKPMSVKGMPNCPP